MPNGRIEDSLPDILPDGVIGCVQKKAWMDNRTMHLWYERVYEPYIFTHDGYSGLLLDDFNCHGHSKLGDVMTQDNALRYMIALVTSVYCSHTMLA